MIFKDNKELNEHLEIPLIGGARTPKTLQVDCDQIVLRERIIDLLVNIPTWKIEEIDCLIINGIKFRKSKKEK